MISRIFLKVVALVFLAVFSGRSQGVILVPGESWSYHFTSMNFIGTEPFAGVNEFSYTITTVASKYTEVSFRLYEGPPSGDSVYGGGYVHAGNSRGSSGIRWFGPQLNYLWQDLEGSVTFFSGGSVDLQGPFSIDSFTIRMYRPNGESYDVFETTVSPVPEPGALSFFAVIALISGFTRFGAYSRARKESMDPMQTNPHLRVP